MRIVNPLTNLLCVALFCTLAAGCSSSDNDGDGGGKGTDPSAAAKRIIILTNGPDPFWDTCEAGAQAAGKDLGLADAGYTVDFQRGDFTDKKPAEIEAADFA